MFKAKFAVCCLLFAVCNAPFAAHAAACNAPNLVRCLDSACVADATMEPGARCAQCGPAMAADAINRTSNYKFGDGLPKMQSLGRPGATSLDLKDAPTGSKDRYSWAAGECIKKIAGCTADDVSKNYDKLIEQSCRAVLTENEYTASLASAAQTKSAAACSAEIQQCMLADSGCSGTWDGCEDTPDFDRVFSSCTLSTGCGHLENLAVIKSDTQKSRDEYFAAKDKNIESLVAKYASARESDLKEKDAACNNGRTKQACAATACSALPNKCKDDRMEQQYAMNLCKYVDIACDSLK